MGGFPAIRLRRLRQAPWSRDLVRETRLHPSDLIWPTFVVEGQNQKQDIEGLPGVQRYSIDLLVEQAKKAKDLGIPVISLFPCLEDTHKDENASYAFDPNNLICQAVQALQSSVPDIGVMCDQALDPYTTHGHDGIVQGDRIDNDLTLEAVVKQTLVQAQAGCNVFGPSEMMDGRVGAMRSALEENSFKDAIILSYAAKYASGLYGPFRNAVGSAKALKGDKRTYQQDPANAMEALREVALDIEEGADMVMIKPAGFYLDVISNVKQNFDFPTLAYQVSGEYAMIHAAGAQGMIDANTCMIEQLISIKRAGADGIMTYAALDVASQI